METIDFINIIETDKKMQEQVRVWRNKEFIRFSSINQRIISIEEHENWLNNLKNKKNISWVVFINKIPAGLVSLQNINYENKESEWGYYIGNENFLGKGYGKKILMKFLEMVFSKLSFKTLTTKVFEKNKKASDIYLKMGFKKYDSEIITTEKGEEKLQILKFELDDWKARRL